MASGYLISKTEHFLMQACISFRPLGRSDFPLVQEWFSAPHGNAWWHERLDLTGIEAKYGPRVDGVKPTYVFVMDRYSPVIIYPVGNYFRVEGT